MTAAKPFTRRQFVAGAGAAGVAGAAALAVARTPLERTLGLTSKTSARAATTASDSARPAPGGRPTLATGHGTLVLVAMYGGNDGLNTLIPYQDAAYLGARPTLGFHGGDALPLDNDLALNPNLKGLKALWDAKSLAIVRGVGHPDPSFSHFREMDIWQSAVPATDEITGWLGRYLDQQGGKDPLYAMSLGPTLPKLLQGKRSAGSAIPAGTLSLPRGTSEAPFAALETPFGGQGDLAGRIARSGTDLLTVLHTVGDVLSQVPAAPATNLESPPPDATPTTAGPAGAKPGTPRQGAAGYAGALGQQLDLVARLIKGGLPTRVYVVSVGGWDTHGNEKLTQSRLLAELDGAVSAFVGSMAADPKGKDVVLMTFSEFGRRVAENASGGTDHGSAAPLFIAGPTVKGGYYGDEPSLTDLSSGNLKFTTDFRSVYATVTADVLGIDPKAVLAGQTFPTIPFV